MIKNCGMYQFQKINSTTDKKFGSLTPIEFPKNIPFAIKRIYYIYNVASDITRGYHSHRELHQILIAVNGSVKIRLKTPVQEEVVLLDNPIEGLYIGPLIWREMFDFSENAVLLVLASEKYDENDYIRDWDTYVNETNKIFKLSGRKDEVK